MAGILKVDQVQSDSNLAFAIAGSNVAFMNATSLQMVGSNVSLAGTNVITNGKVVSSGMPVGSVLQVVNGFTSTAVTTSATDTWIDTGIYAVITPKFSTSKIMVLVNICGMHKTDSSTWNRMGIRVMRDATTIGTTSLRNMYTATTMQLSLPGIMYSKLDSPSSTSAITYGVQFQAEALSSGTGVSVQKDSNSGESQIFLMEIAA